MPGGAQGPCGVNVGGVGEGDNLFILWNLIYSS